jgi:hypothetical protein
MHCTHYGAQQDAGRVVLREAGDGLVSMIAAVPSGFRTYRRNVDNRPFRFAWPVMHTI